MLTSSNSKEAIKVFEGLRLTKYKDIGGVDTIGYGHCGKNLPDIITLTEAEDYFTKDIALNEHYVNTLVKVNLTQEQFDAIVDFCFNLGAGVLKASTLRSKLNRREYSDVPNEIRKWCHCKGIKVPALIKRREFEAKLFMT